MGGGGGGVNLVHIFSRIIFLVSLVLCSGDTELVRF